MCTSILPLILLYFGTVPKVWKCFVFQFIPLKFLEYQMLLYHKKMYSDFLLRKVTICDSILFWKVMMKYNLLNILFVWRTNFTDNAY